MKSKTLLCNRTVFFKDVTRLWPVWVIPILLLQLIFCLPFVSECMNALRYGSYYSDSGSEYTVIQQLQIQATDIVCDGGYVLLLASFAIIPAIFVFQYLNQRRASFMVHSLPISRMTMFGSHFLAGYLMTCVPFLLVLVTAVLISLGNGLHVGGAFCGYFLETISISLFFYSLAVCLVMLSGNSIMSIIMYAVINCVVYVFKLLLDGMVGVFVYGGSSTTVDSFLGNRWVSWLTPVEQMNELVMLQSNDGEGTIPLRAMDGNALTGFHGESVGACALYLIPAVLLVGIALLLYRKRKIEKVDETLVFSWSKVVYRSVFCGCGSLLLTWLVYLLAYNLITWHQTYQSFFFVGCILILLGIVVCYLVCDMILEKTFFIWKQVSYKQMVIIAVVILLLFVSEKIQYENQVKQDAKEVKTVQLEFGGNHFTIEEEGKIDWILQFAKQIQRNGEDDVVNEAEWEKKYSENYSVAILDFKFKKEDGTAFSRSYPVLVDENKKELEELIQFLNEKDMLQSFLSLDKINYSNVASIEWYDSSDSFSGEEMEELVNKQLYNAVMTDLQEGNIIISNAYDSNENPVVEEGKWLGDINIEYINYGTEKDDFVNYTYQYFRITENCRHTISVLKQMLNE